MKAVVITRFGGPEVLEVREVETPGPPAANQVRVRVRAAALNRADILQRMGRYPAPAGAPKDIPGLEFAGEVDVVGDNVQRWKRNQRVFGITSGGAQAVFVVVPENHLAETPQNLDWVEAAAVPEVFITAHDALFTRANLRPGESVMIHAAGSGVGTAAIQLAHAAGAKTFGTSRTAEKIKRAQAFGLTNAVVVDQDPQIIPRAVREWTSGSGVDVIIDLIGAAYLDANLNSLALKGRMILVGTTSGSKAMLDLATVMGKRLTIVGTVLRARPDEEKATATKLFAEQVVPLLANGTVRPVVDRVYRMEEVRKAHARMESNQSFGKIVLLI